MVKQNPSALDSQFVGIIIATEAIINVNTSLVLWTMYDRYSLGWVLTDSLLLVDDETVRKVNDRCCLQP